MLKGSVQNLTEGIEGIREAGRTMKRHTITIIIPDDLVQEVDELLAEDGGEERLSGLVEDALREHLARLVTRDGKEFSIKRPFRITPLVEVDERGEPDVSLHHDKYLAES